MNLGRYECARALLRAGADPNYINASGDHTLFWAIDGQWAQLAAKLLLPAVILAPYDCCMGCCLPAGGCHPAPYMPCSGSESGNCSQLNSGLVHD
jgi:hypothetical protein